MYEHVFESFDVDTVTYMTTVFGIIRAGYAAFPISPRNSPAAIAHLLSTKSVMHILIGGEQSLQSLARTSLNLMKESATNIPGSSPMPLFEEIYVDGKETAYDALPFKRPDMNDPGIIVHSSGKYISIVELTSSRDSLL
jgi:acyl-CoA synthetase (AMP-forming)/AMP-acid ligase II